VQASAKFAGGWPPARMFSQLTITSQQLDILDHLIIFTQ
jgi:hypothetical protein